MDPEVQYILSEFQKYWGVAPLEMLSVDFRSDLMGNVLAAVEPWFSQKT